MSSGAYVHQFDPFAIQFPADWSLMGMHLSGVRWYGLAYLAGFVMGYLVIRLMSKRGTTPMGVVEAADFITMVAVGTMVGGRVGYCLFYAPHLITDFGGGFPFWGVLRVHEGGMASHGGILGIILVCLWWAKKYGRDKFHLLDLVVFGGSLGIFFGRLANFVNGELYGREAPANLSWAVKFPQEMWSWMRDHSAKLSDLWPSVQILGKIPSGSGEVAVTAEQWRMWVTNMKIDSYSWQMVDRAIDQIILQVQSGNTAVIEALAPLLTPRYPSQLIQAGLEGLLVFVILSIMWLKPRKPGVVSAWFGILYAVARIIGEQFRLPDAQIGFQALGLTRGQWLSIAMLAGVLVYYYFVLQRSAAPMGGWGLSQASPAGPKPPSKT